MFFCLSGFLVCGSAQRLRLHDFLLNRAARILPALAVASVLAALIIGPLVTTQSLQAYFTGKDFSHYFLNMVGFIHYELPGVFTANPFPAAVNGSLWTRAFEIACYAVIMSTLVLLGAIKHAGRFVGVAAVIVSAYMMLSYYFLHHPLLFDNDTIKHLIANFVASRGNALYCYFLAGAGLYVFRDRIIHDGRLAFLCVLAIVAIHLFEIEDAVMRQLLLFLPVAYLTIYIGLMKIRKPPLYSQGDYSYGIYVYAYPIQQVLAGLYPMPVLLHFLCALVLVTGVAMASWHGIEKPILGLRKKFSFTARKGDVVEALPRPKRVSEPA
jgi:peptidoglycan/LPS O-acetylase OafA/YrhL